MRSLLLLALVLLLTGCTLGAGMFGAMAGQSPITQWDQGRYQRDPSLPPVDMAALGACARENPVRDNRDAYHACMAQRGAPYFGCLNETAGKGREPFDACMKRYGYTPR